MNPTNVIANDMKTKTIESEPPLWPTQHLMAKLAPTPPMSTSSPDILHTAHDDAKLPIECTHVPSEWFEPAAAQVIATLKHIVPHLQLTPTTILNLAKHTFSQKDDTVQDEAPQDDATQWRRISSLVRDCLWRSYYFDQATIDQVSAIEQRVPLWYLWRSGWVVPEHNIVRGKFVSSSVCGDILGHKKQYEKQAGDESLHMMHTFTQRGTAAEPMIREAFHVVASTYYGPDVQLSIDEIGLQISPTRPWEAVSSDGVVRMWNTRTLSYDESGLEMKCRGMSDSLPYGQAIPHEYFDQVMHTMSTLNLPDYWFACQSKYLLQVAYYKYNHAYWSRQMRRLGAWYWTHYWPTLWLGVIGAFHPDVAIVTKVVDTSLSALKTLALDNRLTTESVFQHCMAFGPLFSAKPTHTHTLET